MKYLLFLLLPFVNSVSSKTCYYEDLADDCDTYVSYPSNNDENVTNNNSIIATLILVFGICISFSIVIYKQYCSFIQNKKNHPNDHLPTYEEANNINNNNNCQNCNSNDCLPPYEEANIINTVSINDNQNVISNTHLPTYEETMAECVITVVVNNDYSSSDNNNTNNIDHSVSVV